MAGVDVGSTGGKRRTTNSEINMIPFIDLLMVTISFLLITAVWVSRSRINADAQVPGRDGCGADCEPITERTLHVNVGENDFALIWKQAGTVISETHVPRNAIEVGDGSATALRYPELAAAVEKEWSKQGAHLDPADHRVDQAILHSDDRAPYRELVAVMDAVHSTHRSMLMPSGNRLRVPAFNLVFATR